MAKVNINDVLQGLIQPIGSLKGGSTYPVTAADQIWVYTDHDTHRPLDEYLGAIKAEAAETTQTFVSNATALTEGKIAKTSIVGGRAAKCKVGDIVLVADGNIYKISAIDETNITLALPALASYATAASLPQNRVLHGNLKDATGAPSYPSGGGGGGVSPRLNLMDRSDSENPTVRTSITEAEKTNIEKGLYNSVFYIDTSLGETAVGSLYLPENAIFVDGSFVFSIYKISMDTVTYAASIKTASIYQLYIEEKDTDGTYPITIEKLIDAPIGGGGGGSGGGASLLNLRDLSSDKAKVRTSITEEEKTNIQSGLYTSVIYMDPSTDTGEFTILHLYYSGQAMFFLGNFIFQTYKWASDGKSIIGSDVYLLNIEEEKNEDGTYPITISPFLSAPFNNVDIISSHNDSTNTYTGTISGDRPVILRMIRPNAAPDNYYIAQKYWENNAIFQVYDYDSTTPTIGTYIAADGKITYKESQLGEKKYYSHCITIDYPNTAHISFNYYSTNGDGLTNDTLWDALNNKAVACSGHVNVKDIHTSKITDSRATYILSQSSGHFNIGYENDVEIGETSIGTEFSMRDRVSLIS